ncbi:retrovirus-related pol polyprotein from transposon TNT 1-94 [Tanacetum coccineum]
MANSNNSFKYPVFHPDLPSSSTSIQQPLPNNNNYNLQPSFNQNYMQQPMPNLEDITDPTAAINTALALMAKAFKLNYSTPTNNNQRISSNPRNRQIAQSADLDEIEEVNANCILMANLHVEQAVEVEKVNSVNRKMKEKNAELTTELARYKNQERCFEISQEKYDKLERCYQQSVYQEQCLSKKINALHLSSGKQITALNEEISNLNKQLSKEKSTVSSLQEEKKRLKSDFKIREDELLDKQIQLENKVKELDNILVKTGQSIQTMHMLSPKPDSFYHTEQKMALGYQNLFYLKQAQQKQQSLYNGNFLLEKHDPPAIYDSEETMELAQKSRLKIQLLNKEIKPANYTKINHLSGVFVSQMAKSRKELYLPNTFKTANVSKSISIPNEEFSDDTTPNVARNFLNKALELEIERLLRAVVSRDIMSIVQNNSVVDTSNLQTELDRTKERFENCIIKKNKLHDTIYANAKLRAQLFDKVSEQKDTTKDTSTNTKFANQSTDRKLFLQSLRNQLVVDKTHDLSNQVTSNSVPTTKESNVIDNDKVIAPGMFMINPFKNSREEKLVPNTPTKARVRINPITVSQPHVIIKKGVNSNSNGFFSKGVDITTKTRRTQPRSNIKNDKVPFASKSSRIKNKEVKVEDHPRNLLLSKNKKHMSYECNNIKLAIQNDKSKIVCAVCLGHNLFSVGQFYDLDLEVAFRRNTCFIRNLEGVDLLKGNRTTNLYTINLHHMASASLICLMARATSTKSWLWQQRLSHLNFDTINDLARNDLVTSLLKFKYHKEHLCPSCEQGKSKRASHPPKPVLNSKQRLHFLHMDLYGPMRIASINGKRYVLNQVLQEYFKSVSISYQASSIRTPQQNGVVERRNRTLVEAARTMLIFSRAPLFLSSEAIATACYTQNRSIIHCRFDKTPYELINGRKLDISFLHVFWALCYPKNDCEDIGKLGTKGDIGFFISYSANSCAYRVYNRRKKKIMETINVTFDELFAMDFEQSSLKPGLQSMTFKQISSGLDLPYAPSTITTQRPTEGELDLLFEAIYDDHVSGQPSAAPGTVSATQAP